MSVLQEKAVLVVGARFGPLNIEQAVLEPLGISIEQTEGASEEDLKEALRKGMPVVLTSARPRFSRPVLEAASGLRCIIRYGVGVDCIDVESAHDLGITVCIVPDASTDEVALHATALILALVRRLREASIATRNGVWQVENLKPMHAPKATIVGIIGLGLIGRLVGRHLASLGFTVLGYDPYVKPSDIQGAPFYPLPSLRELLQRSDVVSLHLPVTDETYKLMNAETFSTMRKGSFLVNVSRGDLIDEGALFDALNSGHLSGAGLDVLSVEPPPKDHPLLTHPKVLVTPHVAWYTEEAQLQLRQLAAEEVARFFRGEPLLHPI